MRDLKGGGEKLKLFLYCYTHYYVINNHGLIIDWQEIGLVVFSKSKCPKVEKWTNCICNIEFRISWIRTSGGLWWKIVQVEFQESFLKMRTSGIRTSWDRTSGGPPVHEKECSFYTHLFCCTVYLSYRFRYRNSCFCN